MLTKSLGTNNPHNVVRATIVALSELRDPDERAAQLGRVYEDDAAEEGVTA